MRNYKKMAEGLIHKSRVLIIGGTGIIGRHIVRASIREGHPTFLLVRSVLAYSVDKERAELLKEFESIGAIILHGDMDDHASLVAAMKKVDVVISSVGRDNIPTLANQSKIITAIKEAGNIKRFLPSEFGSDVERVQLESKDGTLETKREIRRLIRAEGIPYTFVCSHFFHGYILPRLGQADASPLPTDKISILGDGNTQAYFTNEQDIGTFTIRAIDDPRVANKILYIQPPSNKYSQNEIVSTWESLIGKSLERTYISKEEFLDMIHAAPFPANFVLAIVYSAFIKGEQINNLDIEPSMGVEATKLYPDVNYITVQQYMASLL